jgi:8-oxo-dGTP pyrophosphatase MutT (NUDIX family)
MNDDPTGSELSEAAVRRRLREEAKQVVAAARQPPPAKGKPSGRVHPAASVIVVREAPAPGELEILLVRRSQNVRFMPGAWVFPGGRLDEADGPGMADDHEAALNAFRVCAVREAAEEVGVQLPNPDALVWFSHWITPQGLPHRFDTRFFLALAPADAEPVPDGHEVDDARWIAPSDAIRANEADEMTIFFPTLKQLERLVGVASHAEAVAVAEAQPVSPVLPKVVVEDGFPHVVLPGEPGYDDAPPLTG